MTRIALVVSSLGIFLLMAVPASAQDTDKHGDCPYTLGSGAGTQRIIVQSELRSADEFALEPLKKHVDGLAKAQLKKKATAQRCVLKDKIWKIQSTGKDEFWLLWWFNVDSKRIGWIAARQVVDRVYILKSSGDRTFVTHGKERNESRTSFNLATTGGTKHKMKVEIRYPDGPAPKEGSRFDYRVFFTAE